MLLVVSSAGNGLVPGQEQFITWADTDEAKYEISAISLASHEDDALWEFYTPGGSEFRLTRTTSKFSIPQQSTFRQHIHYLFCFIYFRFK